MVHESDANDVEINETHTPFTGSDLFGIVLRRKWLIILGGIVGISLGYLYYLRCPAVYQSTAQLLVVRKNPTAVPVQGIEGQVVVQNEDYMAPHVILMRSPLILKPAVREFRLESLQSFAGVKDPTRTIGSKLIVTREGRDGGGATNILNLSWRGSVADDCSVVLDAVVESYKRFLDDTYMDVSKKTVNLIDEARKVLKIELDEKSKAFSKFREEDGLVWKDKERTLNIHQDRLADIESARSALLLKRAEAEGRLMAVEAALQAGGSRASLMAVISNKPSQSAASANSLDEQLMPLLIQELILLDDFADDHPQVRSMRKRIELTKSLYLRQAKSTKEAEELVGKNKKSAGDEPILDGSIERYIDTLKQELHESKVVEQKLEEHFNRESKSASELAHKEIEAEELLKDLQRTQALFDGVIKRLQEIDLVKNSGGFTTQIINPAGPGWQVEPDASRILTMATILGLLGGIGLAYLVDVSDKSFRTPEEIRRRLGLPVMAHIPLMLDSPADTAPAQSDGAKLSPVICTYHRPNSRDAEAYRGVRTALYFSTRGEGHKVIQITSPNPGDGKSTLAANLAVSIAQSGKRILLIDADFRRPHTHKLFGLDGSRGMASVIGGQAELSESIQTTPIPNLWVLPCGPPPSAPAELLTSTKFQELLKLLREQYEFVVIDTPPLLAVTDPCVVAPRVDGVILALRVSKNGRPEAERAREILANLGAKVVGIVVNGVGNQRGYGYGQYSNQYGYGSYAYYAPHNYGYGRGNDDPYSSYYERDEEDSQPVDSEHAAGTDQGGGGMTAGSDAHQPGTDHGRRDGGKKPRRLLGWLRSVWRETER